MSVIRKLFKKTDQGYDKETENEPEVSEKYPSENLPYHKPNGNNKLFQFKYL